MNKLSRDDLMSLEEYAEVRKGFRADVLAHKQHRAMALGENVRLLFEDRQTIQYQIQEMLRIEKIFERSGIEEELEAYNPLIPDGANLKATMMIEYDDPTERKARLAELIGIEKRVFLQVDGFDKVYPIVNEDLERETDEKTSSVHFLRFEFSPDMIRAWCGGSSVFSGIDHDNYLMFAESISTGTQRALAEDFDPPQATH